MKKPFGFTLIELLVAVVILSLLVLGFFNIDFFSRQQVMTTDRMAKMQNEASFILEHMTKHISKAIGDRSNPPISLADNYVHLIVQIDSNGDGQLTSADTRIAYVIDYFQLGYYPNYINDSAYAAIDVYPNQVRYYPNYINDNSPFEVLSNYVSSDFSNQHITYSPDNNYMDITLQTCWDPAQHYTCGTRDNPGAEMHTRIKMPSVSTH